MLLVSVLRSSQSLVNPWGVVTLRRIEIQIPAEMAGDRLDRVASGLIDEYSRARLQIWIKDGSITVDGETVLARHRVKGGEWLVAVLPEASESDTAVLAEPISLDIHYEDEHLLVINKPAGMVMHTAPGNYQGTLQNGLLGYDPMLAAIPRAGIVHRLDKQTSGLVMVAKTLIAHNSLVQQLQERTVHRMYDALIIGVPVAGGTIEEPIGRHPVDRKRMSVNDRGKPAITHFRMARKFKRHCHVRVKLETGRTHQIRVHMAHIRFPLIGDVVYGGRRQIPGGVSDEIKRAVMEFPRQALNASELGIQHPVEKKEMQWDVRLPDDMQHLLSVLDEGG